MKQDYYLTWVSLTELIILKDSTGNTSQPTDRDYAADTTYADGSGFFTLLEDNTNVPNEIRKFITAIHLGLRSTP